MTPEQARLSFHAFVGDAAFCRFTQQMRSDEKNRRAHIRRAHIKRLRYWQQQLWDAFLADAQLSKQPIDFVWSAMLWCLTHESPLEECDAPVVNTRRCGRCSTFDFERQKQLQEACEALFPYGLGGHGLHCRSCVEWATEWLQSNPDVTSHKSGW